MPFFGSLFLYSDLLAEVVFVAVAEVVSACGFISTVGEDVNWTEFFYICVRLMYSSFIAIPFRFY